MLGALIERTRKANPDLRIASQRIAEARALGGVARSQALPFANAGGEIARHRTSERLAVPPPGNPSTLHTTGFDAGWEVDVFGGLRRNIEAADAEVEASIEAYRDLLVTLFAETAANYIEYRTLNERLRITEANLQTQAESVELTQTRLEDGIAPRIDVTEATTNLETTRAALPQFKTQIRQTWNRIAALTGGYPVSLEPLLSDHRPIPVPHKAIFTGLPADLIRARPDVRQAERSLAAQAARIGVAHADLFPRFTLFGDFGFQSVSTGDLLESRARFYSFGPAFRWEIFSAGRIRSNIQAAEARTEQALLGYENAVLLAVEEVESSMVALALEWDRLAALQRAVASSGETVSLVKDNYREGLVDFQRVLDAERTKFDTEDHTAVSRGQIALNYVALYKALGGGSQVEVIPDEEPRIRVRTFGGPVAETRVAPEPVPSSTSAP